MSIRKTGTVKQFSNNNGFGYITPDNSEKDLYVHHSAIEGTGFRTLEIGERVEFTVEASDKGPRAAAVVRL